MSPESPQSSDTDPRKLSLEAMLQLLKERASQPKQPDTFEPGLEQSSDQLDPRRTLEGNE